MSQYLAAAATMGAAYLHSPVDDLESCFWVVLWSVVFNKDQEELFLAREINVGNVFVMGMRGDAIGKLGIFGGGGSDIMQCFQPVLRAWWCRVRDKNEEWMD